MSIEKIVFAMSFIVLIFSFTAHASSSVWKISKGNNYLYLSGTIHLLGKADYPLPSAFDKAYVKSSRLVFETDIQKFNTPEYQKIFMGKLTYSGQRTIKDDKKFSYLEEVEEQLSYLS